MYTERCLRSSRPSLRDDPTQGPCRTKVLAKKRATNLLPPTAHSSSESTYHQEENRNDIRHRYCPTGQFFMVIPCRQSQKEGRET